jgi:hypothetical protein
MKYLFLFTIILVSCQTKQNWPIQLGEDEMMEVQSSTFSCFNSSYYKTRIERKNKKYIISFNECKKIDPMCHYLECFSLVHKRTEIWDQSQLDTFFKTIITDTGIQSTSSIIHLVIFKGDTLELKQGGTRVEFVSRFYK